MKLTLSFLQLETFGYRIHEKTSQQGITIEEHKHETMPAFSVLENQFGDSFKWLLLVLSVLGNLSGSEWI